MNIAEKQITSLYLGYFNRAADRQGLDFWIGQANAGGSLFDIANSFAAGSEYQSIYGGLSSSALIDRIYDNLFNRAPDAAGKAYWQAQLDGGMASASLIVNVISGAQGNDRLVLENTAIVAKDWTSRQSGIAQEIITGMDPNGNMADGLINLHMTPDELASYAPITTVMAHEIGHLIAYRTQINNAIAEHLTNYDGFISAEGGVLSFNGPNAVAAYGGPVPIHRIGAFNNYAHVDDGNLLMYPYVSLYDFKMPGIVDFGVIADMGITVA